MTSRENAKSDRQPKRRSIEIYKASNAKPLTDQTMKYSSLDESSLQQLAKLSSEGLRDGDVTRVIFSNKEMGLSVVYVWFKEDFPLPRHSHNADCLYYIISGELAFGTETLRAGDSFLIPSGALYTYTPGPDGVELLEIRTAVEFDINVKNSSAMWAAALETTRAMHETWRGARAPEAAARMTSGEPGE